ncbi:MAG: hypothetical protein AAGF20_03645, partial [Pseudomonadota bacterium]
NRRLALGYQGELLSAKWTASTDVDTVSLMPWIGAAFLVLALAAFMSRNIGVSLIAGVATSLALGWHARIHVLPTQLWVQPTESARLALQQVCGVPGNGRCDNGLQKPDGIQSIGYNEPSYVMSFGTQNLHQPETVVHLPSQDSVYPMVFLMNMEDRGALPAVETLLTKARLQNRCVRRSEPVYSLNYSNGDPVNFVALRFDREPCPEDASTGLERSRLQ